MNHGPLIFLAAFFALAASWFGLVFTPVTQIGHLQQTNTVGLAASYPLGRPGLARQGLEVYRANGCGSCHSQQIGQSGTLFDLLLSEPGTNQPALLTALAKIRSGSSDSDLRTLLGKLPQTIRHNLSKAEADADVKALSAAGAKAQLWLVLTGPDIARSWGVRRTVAEDYLFDSPVILGSQRVGPDLANIGARQPNSAWHLQHLYAPRSKVPGSTMAPYRFLFETRKIERNIDPEALVIPADWPTNLKPPAGYEIVPRPEARALVAYLLSLRADAPLFVTPMSVASAPAPVAATNAPAATGTNSPAITPAPK